MGVVIGIDVGGSTTKIIGVENKSIQSPMFVKATDPVTSLFGAFGKYIYDNGITLPEIEMVMLTVWEALSSTNRYTACRQPRPMNFWPTALGAKYIASAGKPDVVSMGTGTSFVRLKDRISSISAASASEAEPCSDSPACSRKRRTSI